MTRSHDIVIVGEVQLRLFNLPTQHRLSVHVQEANAEDPHLCLNRLASLKFKLSVIVPEGENLNFALLNLNALHLMNKEDAIRNRNFLT